MKILLIDPLHKVWEFFRGHTPSPGLLATAAHLRKEGHDVTIHDGTCIPKKPWLDLQHTLEREQPEVIGITATMTVYHHDAIDAARLAKAILPDVRIFIGGQHAAATCEEHLLTGLFDAIIMQESESTFGPLLDAISEGKPISSVKGIAYKDDDGAVRISEAAPMVADLDDLPRPAYDMVPMDLYSVPALGGKIGLAATFSRGCVHRCTFCPDSAFWKHTARQNSARRTVEILDWLSKDYNRHVYYVGDDNFLWKRERNEEFIREMERVKPDVRLWIQSTVTDVIRNEELLPHLRKVGVFQLMVGIETVDEDILKGYNKSFNAKAFEKAVAIGQKHDFLMMGMLTWGAWEDTRESLRNTLKYIIKHCDILAPNTLTPYPGTKLHEQVKKAGRIHIGDYRMFDQMHIIMPTKEYTVEEAEKLYSSEIGKALMTNPKALANVLLLPKKPQLRTYMRQFYKMGFRALIRRPWVQKNWQSFEDFIRRDFRPPKSKRKTAAG